MRAPRTRKKPRADVRELDDRLFIVSDVTPSEAALALDQYLLVAGTQGLDLHPVTGPGADYTIVTRSHVPGRNSVLSFTEDLVNELTTRRRWPVTRAAG